jgi:HSP20 family protein
MTYSLLPSLFGKEEKNRPPFQSTHNEIDRVFNDFRKTFAGFNDNADLKTNGWVTPNIDISENDEAIDITAELPGVKEEDIDISVTNDILVIKGEKSDSREEEENNYHLIERSYGSYMRSIPLGFDVDETNVKATTKDGVLNISIPKPAEIKEKTKKIPVSKAS